MVIVQGQDSNPNLWIHNMRRWLLHYRGTVDMIHYEIWQNLLLLTPTAMVIFVNQRHKHMALEHAVCLSTAVNMQRKLTTLLAILTAMTLL